jgi:hypothetical protein
VLGFFRVGLIMVLPVTISSSLISLEAEFSLYHLNANLASLSLLVS